jgi:hypothetical protein
MVCYTNIGDPKSIMGPTGDVSIDIKYSKCNERVAMNLPMIFSKYVFWTFHVQVQSWKTVA